MLRKRPDWTSITYLVHVGVALPVHCAPLKRRLGGSAEPGTELFLLLWRHGWRILGPWGRLHAVWPLLLVPRGRQSGHGEWTDHLTRALVDLTSRCDLNDVIAPVMSDRDRLCNFSITKPPHLISNHASACPTSFVSYGNGPRAKTSCQHLEEKKKKERRWQAEQKGGQPSLVRLEK